MLNNKIVGVFKINRINIFKSFSVFVKSVELTWRAVPKQLNCVCGLERL